MLCAYADIGTSAAAEGIFRQVLARYNQKCKPMRLVFFDDALDQLLRMHRTLCLPQVQNRCHIPSVLCTACAKDTCSVFCRCMKLRTNILGDSWPH